MITDPELSRLYDLERVLHAAEMAEHDRHQAMDILNRVLYPDDYAEPEAVPADVQQDCDRFHEQNEGG